MTNGKSRKKKIVGGALLLAVLTTVAAVFGKGGGGTAVLNKLFGGEDKKKSVAQHRYAVLVQKASDSRWIEGATVELAMGADKKHLTTDTDGRAEFMVPPIQEGISAHVWVSAPYYIGQNRQVTIPVVDGREEFALERDAPPPPKQPYFRDFTTGSVPSGSGAGWSDWYSLTSDTPQPGYVIDLNPDATYFTVSGDRNCKSNPTVQEFGWLNCQWLQHDQQQVKFQFRLQGHNEWTGSGQALSTGRLHITYVPVPQ
jgi:hypothetical protein